ncbi:hypothetical protein B566_EDAN009166 [Ephemera danica]|nr:hypothetical protein B566_EDAN009166 [Ephemera danica]
MYCTPLVVLFLAIAVTAAPIAEFSSPDIVVNEPGSLTALSIDGDVVLVRQKRQNFGRGGGRYRGGGGGFRGGYPGAGGGFPGGFGGGFPQQGAFQNPSFSSSAANAQAQAFNAGNFGASSSGANTQGFSVGPNGIQGSAGQSFAQSYKFPGLDISVSGAESFGVGPGGVTRGGGSAVTVNGKPFNG